jgi:ParB/RepB/Spo0J family partition protein
MGCGKAKIMQHKYGYTSIELPVEKIQRDVNQPRKDFGTEGDKNKLIVSMKQYGILNDICVTEYEPGRYLIIDGHRRYICAQALNYEQVPCRVYPKLSNAELETLRYEIQNVRRPWKPHERSESLDRIKIEKGFTSNKQLAEHLSITEAIVANSLQLRKQKMDHIDLMNRYELSESYRIEFVRLKPKLRKIKDVEVDDIIINLFSVYSTKSSRTLKNLGSLVGFFGVPMLTRKN